MNKDMDRWMLHLYNNAIIEIDEKMEKLSSQRKMIVDNIKELKQILGDS